jgi:hypothetical protein
VIIKSCEWQKREKRIQGLFIKFHCEYRKQLTVYFPFKTELDTKIPKKP